MVDSDISHIIEELKQELEIIGIEFKKYKSVYTPTKLLAEPKLSSYPKNKYKFVAKELKQKWYLDFIPVTQSRLNKSINLLNNKKLSEFYNKYIFN